MQSCSDLLASVLPRLLQRAPLTPEKVQFAWRAAVGPQVARATSVRLHDRRLFISASDSRWAREVERAAPLILPKLRSLLGDAEITGLVVNRG